MKKIPSKQKSFQSPLLRCIEGSQVLEGRLPFQCYSTKAKVLKQEYNVNCCKEDFCNDNILSPPGTKLLHQNTLINQNKAIVFKYS
jgi:Activin types I and II receptor domain